MKALKALFLFLAMMYAGNSYAQTKEETISWLKEKLTKNIEISSIRGKVESIKVLAIDECSITVGYTKIYTDNSEVWTETLPTHDISEADIHGGWRFKYPAEVVRRKLTRLPRGTEEHFNTHMTTFSIREVEIDLRSRILKAIKHLATFCEKKKETF